ncbi:hypothetical protein J4232_02835 [Candidatus Woesearchaeota archaeon]|nr:hypothetical protein [Candidatus Woesearchaeota archaeon]
MGIQELGLSIAQPLLELILNIGKVLPGLVAAVLVLVFGYLVAWVVYYLLGKLFDYIQLDEYLVKKTNLNKRVGNLQVSHILAVISKWYVFVLFLIPAAGLVKLDTFAELLVRLSIWIPKLIAAVLVSIVGLVAIDYVISRIIETKANKVALVAKGIEIVLYIFLLLLVLEQFGINITLAENSFLLVVGGVMLALGLAFGLGFGLALKEPAAKLLKNLNKKL